jgi:hypothetical protein
MWTKRGGSLSLFTHTWAFRGFFMLGFPRLQMRMRLQTVTRLQTSMWSLALDCDTDSHRFQATQKRKSIFLVLLWSFNAIFELLLTQQQQRRIVFFCLSKRYLFVSYTYMQLWKALEDLRGVFCLTRWWYLEAQECHFGSHLRGPKEGVDIPHWSAAWEAYCVRFEISSRIL